MAGRTVKELSVHTVDKTKNVNITLIARDEYGKIIEACIMLGRGDERYIEKIIELMKEYVSDGAVDRMIEIYGC